MDRYQFELIEWQIAPPRVWWRLWPWWSFYPRDEDGPAELVFGIGIFQFRAYLWDRYG